MRRLIDEADSFANRICSSGSSCSTSGVERIWFDRRGRPRGGGCRTRRQPHGRRLERQPGSPPRPHSCRQGVGVNASCAVLGSGQDITCTLQMPAFLEYAAAVTDWDYISHLQNKYLIIHLKYSQQYFKSIGFGAVCGMEDGLSPADDAVPWCTGVR